MKEFFHKYKHVWILSYGLVYLTWFFHLERTVTKGYHVIHVRLDDYIPFEEIFIVHQQGRILPAVYLSVQRYDYQFNYLYLLSQWNGFPTRSGRR